MKDIQRMRRQRMSPEQVADSVAEQGRGFEVTPDIVRQLRGLGFRPAQIDAIKESSREPLLPGRSLATSDEEREDTFKQMKQVAVKSRAAIEPVQSQHVTLWAAKDLQRAYLPELQQLETFFHTKCAEPIRSGLDKRSTHVVLLKDRAEYGAWCRTMFDLFGKQFAVSDHPGANAHFRGEVLKAADILLAGFCAVSVGELPLDRAHRYVACGVAGMYFVQLANPLRCGPLQTGFEDGAEAVVFGSPSVMLCTIAYGEKTRGPAENRQAWSLLVQQRMATNQATPLGELLQMDHPQDVAAALRRGMDACGALEQATRQVRKTAA